MSVLRCLSCDDEPLAVRLLESYVERHPSLTLAGAFTNPQKALDELSGGHIDVAFLDIEMPGLSGMEIARAIAGKSARVVFVTAYRDYAVEGFRVQALDYLLKPVSYEEFCAATERATALISPPDHIMVTSNYRRVRLSFDDILLIQGLKDYVKVYRTNYSRPILTQMSLKELETSLPSAEFRRVHRSYIINTAHIDYIAGSNIRIGQQNVPIGATYRDSIVDLL